MDEMQCGGLELASTLYRIFSSQQDRAGVVHIVLLPVWHAPHKNDRLSVSDSQVENTVVWA